MDIKYLDRAAKVPGGAVGIGDSICSCCGSRVAGELTVWEERWNEDEDDYYDVKVDCKFENYDQGIIVQLGEHGVPGDNGSEEITHVKTSNGTISVRVRYVW